MTKLNIILGIIILSTSSFAFGARFPNAVEKKMVITGSAADAVAKLFGLSTHISLRLGRSDAWAVYLLKQDTNKKLWNDNNGSPERYNTIEYLSSKVSSLTIFPYWLDSGTRLPVPKTGYYSFSSPFLSEAFNQDDPWMKLLRRLQSDPAWNNAAKIPFLRCFLSCEEINICIEVTRCEDYPDNIKRTGNIVTITVHLLKNQKGLK